MANDSENLIFKLVADTKDFISGIKGALDNALKQVGDYQKRASEILKGGSGGGGNPFAKQLESEFNRLSQALALAEKQFQMLKSSNLGWRDAAKNAGASVDETKGLFDQLVNTTQRYGISLEQAAINAISSGRAQVAAVQQVLEENKKAVLTEEQLNQAIKQLRANVDAASGSMNTYTSATQKANTQTQNLANTTNKASISFGTMVKNALAFVGVTSAFQVVSGIFEKLKEATDAAVEFSQAQFTLAVNVKAAANATNGQSGTLEEWQARIRKLRQELGVFSETDITKAISQTTVLTRVLGLNADQQEQVIKIGSLLAQTAGVTLAQGVDDVTKALGGSSVVLDKYGLFLRDADKAALAFELGFTDKIQKGTNSLNSQQLALSTLYAIQKQINPLAEEFGGYQETLPGQLKAVDAAITENMTQLGLLFDGVVLGLKTAYADFLGYIADIANNPILKTLLDFIDESNRKNQERKGAGADKTISPEDFGLTTRSTIGRGGNSALDPITGIRFYTREQLQGDEENIDAYLAAVDKAIKDVKAALRSSGNELTRDPEDKKPTIFDPYKTPSLGYGSSAPEATIDENFLNAQEDFSKKIIDAYNDMARSQRDALRERNSDLEDLNQDYLQELEDLNTELARKQRDIERNFRNKGADATRKYYQDLAEIEIDEQEKREDIIKEGNDRTEEIWEDYYRRLRELDAQYYFDLRDAVADNDAVAVKRLERKYALEKQKLDEQLADKLDDEQDAIDDRLGELEDETRDRQAELDRRYKQELETLAIEKQRARDEAHTWYSREVDDLVKNNERRKAEIEEEYQEELELIEIHYQDRLNEIVDSLAEQYDLEKGALRKLFTLYDEYYGDGGKLWDMIDEFYEHQEELAGEFNDNVGDLDEIDNENDNVTVTTTNNGSTMSVVISGDGSISDSTLDKLVEEIAAELADSIEQVVVSRGGGSSGSGR